MHPVLNGMLGGWSVMGVGRIQARTINFGNVRLVGMSANDLQEMYQFDIRVNPDTGLRTVYMLPDDVILNTRRAFSVSATTADGYSTSLGAPEGRYIAPANTADCIEIVDGDCGPRPLLIRAPFFTRFDYRRPEALPDQGHAELRAAARRAQRLRLGVRPSNACRTPSRRVALRATRKKPGKLSRRSRPTRSVHVFLGHAPSA